MERFQKAGLKGNATREFVHLGPENMSLIFFPVSKHFPLERPSDMVN